MRSQFLTGLGLVFWQTLALAQGLAPGPAGLDASAERQRIAQERAGHEAVYLQAERACYSHFAVSDCLRNARKDRRLAFDELRRQELILNDMDRQTKAMQALKRIESSLEAQQQKQLDAAGESAQTPP